VAEEMTPVLRRLFSTDSSIVISVLTRVELASAIWRRRAPRELNREAVAAEVIRAAAEWTDVPVDKVIAAAVVACEQHRLRAGDALQLGAALHASEGSPSTLPFVTLDRDLASAARAEGFPILP
jgi:predicted nucleic acid-binding protein